MPVVAVIVLALTMSLGVVAPASSASDATLFRIFLRDGTSVVSYGEFARIDGQVIFSMPAGGSAAEPRLQVVTLPEATVDWYRTEQYVTVARAQHYADTRGEDDFQQLSNEVARALNEIALSTDKAASLRLADQARRMLTEWPAAHYGYRQKDIREIVGLLDEAISDLRASLGQNDFAISFVATPLDAAGPVLLGAPSAQEQIEHTFRVAGLATRVSDKLTLLQSVLTQLNEAGGAIPSELARDWRKRAEGQIREEQDIDRKYASFTSRYAGWARDAARKARIRIVERMLDDVIKEDAKLGGRRPEVVEALTATLRAELDNARRLQLLRDQWSLRRQAYREYQKTVGADLLRLAKLQPSLEAIRRLTGPPPAQLAELHTRLQGGADRLQRMTIAEDLKAAHGLIIGAWRFAESAVDTRYSAVRSGDVSVAWQASSSAAGAILFIDKAQRELRTLLQPPQLQ